MTSRYRGQAALDAMDAFRQAPNEDALWAALDKHLEPFGISGTVYGTDCMLGSGPELAYLRSSIRPGWLEAKIDAGLFYDDAYVEYGLVEDQPLLWSDEAAADDLSPSQLASLALDYDYKVTTGVTLPVSFAGGLGRSAFGCHADGVSWKEFDRLWAENQEVVKRILLAFDLSFRRDILPAVQSLESAERECLQRLAAGQPAKGVAHAMRISEARYRSLVRSACRKMSATNASQAVAQAVVLGFISP